MKWLRNILKASTLTTALFIFQACYGTPHDMMLERERGVAPMSFSLVSDDTGAPLEGIKILASETDTPTNEIGITGTDGRCKVELFYLRNIQGPNLRFQDPEGQYVPQDTTLADLREREIVIKMVAAK